MAECSDDPVLSVFKIAAYCGQVVEATAVLGAPCTKQIMAEL